jgi:hypothetical protein
MQPLGGGALHIAAVLYSKLKRPTFKLQARFLFPGGFI